jgi:hypothetical protein
MRSAIVLTLALLPPLIAAAWTWMQMRKAEQDLESLANFEGMHLER